MSDYIDPSLIKPARKNGERRREIWSYPAGHRIRDGVVTSVPVLVEVTTWWDAGSCDWYLEAAHWETAKPVPPGRLRRLWRRLFNKRPQLPTARALP